MTVSHTPGAMKRFRRTSWRFQQTVERPHAEELGGFVAAITAVIAAANEATITIDQIVFGAERLSALCPAGSPLPLARDTSISTSAYQEMNELLVAAFMDGPDFVFVPSPRPFVFYADHDNWITFLANTKSNLNRIIEPLASSGYRLIENWRREL